MYNEPAKRQFSQQKRSLRVFGGGEVKGLDVAVWDQVMATNLRGVFMVTKAFLPVMSKADGGTVESLGGAFPKSLQRHEGSRHHRVR